jgi:hypothetical protein
VREIGGTAHAVPFDAPGTFAQVITEAMRSPEMAKAAPHSEDSVRARGDERCT